MLELNSRELANAIWIVGLLLWCSRSSDVRDSLLRLFQSLLHWKVFVPIVSMGAYVSGIVWVLDNAGYWSWALLKPTSFWFMFSGILLLVNAGSNSKNPSVTMYQTLIDSLKIAVLVEYLVWAYTFPLLVELVLAPILFVLIAVEAMAETKPELADAKIISTPLLVIIGVVVLGDALWQVAADFARFASWDTARHVMLAPLLSFLTLPFVYLFCIVSQYEMVLSRLKLNRNADPAFIQHAKWQILARHGVRLEKLSRFLNEAGFRLMGIRSREELNELFESSEEGNSAPCKALEQPRGAID